ncbi:MULTISPECIES: glutamate synthase large subunit [unclassified Vibrio]|uniref:glutamate synthase large subunit n=1 Tax=unclassified Vibrio TaxID=2614977 RepID=UPI0027BD0A19|nr:MULTISPECIES: glutamate synthase large subunit [unclassified Vibrio]EKO3893844.1 glutamate synthase large subunit [Vibrio metschnikovii]MDQ2108170.1 glutamate synthase large subunit [Vibrio sp. 2017_1457_15]MDQ2160983.1 glutamate synthase large subunit [Vibrio sp. 2017_1457_13]MDQ2190268.1 glutamate synthase large subunit [Vibrio sp. A14(2019)]
MVNREQSSQGLYTPELEHDACGIGFVAHLKNRKSHHVVTQALDMLARMEHRGGQGCDPCSGDGAGILLQKPHEFLLEEAVKLGIKLPSFDQYGVGVVLFPRDEHKRAQCRDILERNAKRLDLDVLGYRKLPTDNSMLGADPLSTEPYFEHVFISAGPGSTPQELERKLYVLRNYTVRVCLESVSNIGDDFYINSLSYKTLVYKGQLTTEQVPQYFLDLQNPTMVTALALVHSRFSTNTFPRWRLAQPFRYIAHNGEINTVRGNLNWMKAREAILQSNLFTQTEIDMLLPVCQEGASDSANFDMVLELLVLSGRTLPHALMMMIPEAWQENKTMDPKRRAFYQYHANIMEPWDGPASVCFTDGVQVGATLDRNGLRPSRYTVTKDDFLIMASESGVVEIDPANVEYRGRLQPGRIFVADLEQGRIISDEEVKDGIANAQPYEKWVEDNLLSLKKLPEADNVHSQPSPERLLHRQQAFGVSSEEVNDIIFTLAETGYEPLGSMGADWPVAVLSHQSQHLSNYFKQLFAQVTNPPIDPIRERMVMSLNTYIGRDQNLLAESPVHCRKVELESPVISNAELEKLRAIDNEHLQAKTLDIVFQASEEPGKLERALKRICQYAEDAVIDGYSIILLTDRAVNSNHAAIPAMLAVGAVHHHLIRKGLRSKCGIVVETGDARETHHFATLVGYGANAVNPYLVVETIVDLQRRNKLDTDVEVNKYFENYRKGINAGLLKIFSKMGISTLQSYHGAQIFEALGISKSVVDKYFTGTVTRIQGLTLDDIAKEVVVRHRIGYPIREIPLQMLDVGGVYQWKQRGEKHLFNPETIHLLQHSTRNKDYQQFKQYAAAVDSQGDKAVTLRSQLDFIKNPAGSVAIEDVEPVSSIVKRFATGAMSFGSISHEAHSTLAVAMNRLGARSNSGEGGEDPARFVRKENGDWERSAIKQVASGRFGVTSYYLTNCDEIQIKMAQGAKPGEGGQLPGDKVDDWIGATRHSTPGVGLISPPPHHDIYSIEDLAQLIFDLKNANRKGRVNVKLVSEAGVGTIASGVAKAKADVVLIAGHDGGTGASPISSIRHTGLPWELGLAETHQTLLKNGLRNRIVVQADGQMKTPRDIAIATLLGAEEWGVATAALVVEGCIMMRKCHKNTCPVGIATQNKTLRERFDGRVEDVVTFFQYMAQGLREIMAELGFRTIDEMVGQAQKLKLRDDVGHWKYKNLDLSPLLYLEPAREGDGIYCQSAQNHNLEHVLDRQLIQLAKPALEQGLAVNANLPIINTDRSTGTMLSNEICKVYQDQGLPQPMTVKFNGSAGQSFGAFLTKGVHFEVEGDANDYWGKGLSGGTLVLYPNRNASLIAEDNIVVGNVCFYGATSGESYIRGLAGERFCVRNSGAKVVVEGVGDHGCEYMTGGIAVILGSTGRNFAAGMSGGIAYVWDKAGDFSQKLNPELVDLDPIEAEDKALLKDMLTKHVQFTGSEVAQTFLNNFEQSLATMMKVMPRDYKAVLEKRKEAAAAMEKAEAV